MSPLHLVNDLVLRTAEDVKGTHPWKGQVVPQMPDTENESDCALIDFCNYVVDEFVSTAVLCF